MGIKRLQNRELARITAGSTRDDQKGKFGKVLGGLMAENAGFQHEIISKVGADNFVRIIKYVLDYGRLPTDDRPKDPGDTGGGTGDGGVVIGPIVDPVKLA